MKKTIILITAIIILGSGSLMAEPKLDTDYKHYSFGWVPQNAVSVQYCIIRSVGTDTLIINDIISSQSNLSMPLEKQILPPGDSVIIPIIWQFGSTTGKKTVFCRVITNEESSLNGKPLQIKIDGIVISNPGTLQPVVSSPYRLEFSKIGDLDIDSLEFTLTNNSIRELELEIVGFSSVEFEYSMPDSLKPNSSITAWVKIKPAYLANEFQTSITIRMTDKLRFDRSLTLPIRRKSYSK